MRARAPFALLLACLLGLTLTGCGADRCPAVNAQPEQAHGHAARGGETPAHRGHRFDDPDELSKRWDSPERTAWQKPDEVISLLELEPDAVVADVGTGTGYFAVRLAARLPAGRVWAVDIEPAMVRHVAERAREEELDNIFAILGQPEDPLLPEPVDRVLIVDTYHHITHRVAYLESLKKHLRPDARVAIVDFQMGDIPVGPPESMRVPPDETRRELESAGYRVLTDVRDTLPHQYVLIAEPR